MCERVGTERALCCWCGDGGRRGLGSRGRDRVAWRAARGHIRAHALCVCVLAGIDMFDVREDAFTTVLQFLFMRMPEVHQGTSST